MPELLELVRRLLQAFNDGDVETACEITDPAVRFTVIAEQVTGELPDGHDGLRQWFGAAMRTWEHLRAEETAATIERRGDWVMVEGRTKGRARGTGRELEWAWAAIGRERGGRLVEFGVYLDREQALRAMKAGAAASFEEP
jgi:ketosteroid isomerase-like protein